MKTTSLLLLAAILLSACQLFEPLPTLPPVLTLEPLAPEATPSVSTTAQPTSVPETPANEAQQSTEANATSATQPVQASASPASATSLPPTQAPSAVPSSTSKPTKRPAATATPPAPTTISAAAWREVPIMSGATEGKEEDGSYSYTVNAGVADVQKYYERMMPLTGWEPFATGEGEAGNLLLMYQKGNITATIGLIDQGGNTLVLIVAE